jgi:hypothetical protein
VGIRCADHATPLSTKIGTKFADKRLFLGIVRTRTKATEFSFSVSLDVDAWFKVVWRLLAPELQLQLPVSLLFLPLATNSKKKRLATCIEEKVNLRRVIIVEPT